MAQAQPGDLVFIVGALGTPDRGGVLVVNVLSVVFGALGLFLLGVMILVSNGNG